MKDIILILLSAFLIYCGVATIAPNASFVGFVGHFIGSQNHAIFGAIGYIYPFALIFALLKLRGDFAPRTPKFALNCAGVALMILAFLMIFSMFGAQNGGLLGAKIITNLRRVVGSVGTGVVTLAVFLIAFLLLYGELPRVFWRESFARARWWLRGAWARMCAAGGGAGASAGARANSNLGGADGKGANSNLNNKNAAQTQRKNAQFEPLFDENLRPNAKFEFEPQFDPNAAANERMNALDAQNIAAMNAYADGQNADLAGDLAGDLAAQDFAANSADLAQNPPFAAPQFKQISLYKNEVEIIAPNEQNPAPNSNLNPAAAQNAEPNSAQNPAQNAPQNLARQHSAKNVEILQEIKENTALLDQLEKGKTAPPKDFELPPLDFLALPSESKRAIDEAEIDCKIANLLEKLRRFKIDGDVVRTYSGPVVTTFEFKPAANVKVSRILTLQDDLAMALRAQTIRLQAPVPGKDVVGIEIPNAAIETIYLREILQSEVFKNAKSELTIALGKDIVGNAFVTDLKKLPHLLIAGTTGSGKSVGINSMLLSLLYRNSPQTLRLIMIDPKMLEFSVYNEIPHLLTPVITEPKKAIIVLSNLVGEMERRYKMMSKTKTKNIETFNAKMRGEGGETLPFIVVIIDELADLMMTSGKEVEFHIGRLAQMARASGIHLIVATQRPSVDVVTGLIKANLPSRISYRVGQKIDSKVIIDQMGAESLLGRGDMLFTPPGSPGVVRLHAPFASEGEIERIVEFLKAQQEVCYDESYLYGSEGAGLGDDDGERVDVGELDELFEEAKRVVLEDQKTSISYLQRRLKIGYNRAATIIEQLANAGILSAVNAKGQREIIGG